RRGGWGPPPKEGGFPAFPPPQKLGGRAPSPTGGGPPRFFRGFCLGGFRPPPAPRLFSPGFCSPPGLGVAASPPTRFGRSGATVTSLMLRGWRRVPPPVRPRRGRRTRPRRRPRGPRRR